MAENVFVDSSNTTAAAAAESSTWSPTSIATTSYYDPDDDHIEPVYVQQIIIAKVVSSLSAIGSAYIIYNMVINVKSHAERQKNLYQTYNRLLLCLCVSDFISSTSYFMGSWAIPANPPAGFEEVYGGPGYWNKVFPQAMGTTTTCTAQAFLMYFASCLSILFTGCISVSFLLQVKFSFKEKQMRIVEKVLFVFCTTYALCTKFFILADKGFNPIPMGICYVAPDPWICSYPWEGSPRKDNIQQYCDANVDLGGTYTQYYSLFAAAPVAIVFLIIVTSTGMIFWSVRTQELRAAKWSEAAASGRDQKRVFVKCMLYVGAFMVVWIPVMLIHFIDLGKNGKYYIAAFFAPLQGVLNALIYSNLFSVFKDHARSVSKSMRSSITRRLSITTGTSSTLDFSTLRKTTSKAFSSAAETTKTSEIVTVEFQKSSNIIIDDDKTPAARVDFTGQPCDLAEP